MKIVIILLMILVLLLLLYLLSVMPRMTHRPDLTPFLGRLYAHRGLHDNCTDAPENSLPAFARAVGAGFGIELDVQLTKDRVPVVFHDFNARRICGTDQKISEMSFEEVRRLRLCGTQQQIPSFEEVLKLVDGKVPLIVEYKIESTDTSVCELGDRLLSEYQGVYCVESFNPLGVLWYKKHRSDVLRGILSDNYVKKGDKELPVIFYQMLHNMMFNFIAKPDFIAYNSRFYRDWSRQICRIVYRAPAFAWTIKSQEELEKRQKDYDLFIFDSFLPREFHDKA